jgi:hypothetical protein
VDREEIIRNKYMKEIEELRGQLQAEPGLCEIDIMGDHHCAKRCELPKFFDNGYCWFLKGGRSHDNIASPG